jgi:ABC-type Na+ transport system ATPase subunit NatA
MSATLLERRGIEKMHALPDSGFDISAGAVHVLLCENGAGKSTRRNRSASLPQARHSFPRNAEITSLTR